MHRLVRRAYPHGIGAHIRDGVRYGLRDAELPRPVRLFRLGLDDDPEEDVRAVARVSTNSELLLGEMLERADVHEHPAAESAELFGGLGHCGQLRLRRNVFLALGLVQGPCRFLAAFSLGIPGSVLSESWNMNGDTRSRTPCHTPCIGAR